MKKRTGDILYGVLILLLVVSAVFLIVNKKTQKANIVTPKKVEVAQNNALLDKYRTDPVPENCRIPEYENDLKRWAEHLSHHESTRYCLEYYEGLY